MNVDYKKIGIRIHDCRKQQHMTQQQLAALCNISVQYMSYIEQGRKRPSLDVLMDIADQLNVNMDELLYGNRPDKGNEYHSDVNNLLKGCSRTERRFIYEMVNAIRVSLKGNGWKIS